MENNFKFELLIRNLNINKIHDVINEAMSLGYKFNDNDNLPSHPTLEKLSKHGVTVLCFEDGELWFDATEEHDHPFLYGGNEFIITLEKYAPNNSEKKADRFNDGKPRWSLVDFDSLEPMVKVLEYGCKKYDANNWKKGLKTTEIIESMMRHMQAYLRGEDIDPESKLPHTGHIMCNAMFLSYMNKYMPDFDSRFKDENKELKHSNT